MIKSIDNFLSALNSAKQQGPLARSAAPEVAAHAPVDNRAVGRLLVSLPASIGGQGN